jgi:hypothetical protein
MQMVFLLIVVSLFAVNRYLLVRPYSKFFPQDEGIGYESKIANPKSKIAQPRLWIPAPVR